MNVLKWMICWGVFTAAWLPAHAQEADSSAAASVSSISASAESSEVSDRSVRWGDRDQERRGWRGPRGPWRDSDDAMIAIDSDATLPAGETKDAVVVIRGNATVAGTVRDAVVAIAGNTQITGPVGDNVVTIMGNSYINSRVDGDVMTVMGKTELGPDAEITGKVTTVGGQLVRDAGAVVGRSHTVHSNIQGAEGLKAWVNECLMYGRWLAFDGAVMWAWIVAGLSLLFYVATAALVPKTVAYGVQVLEERPGQSILAALCAIPLVPMMLLVLVITIVGILAIPFVMLGLFCLGWFGKLIVLAWMGKRMIHRDSERPVSWVLAVLVAGLLMTLLYAIPVVGMVVSYLLKFVGFGVALLAMLLMFRSPARRPVYQAAQPSQPYGANQSGHATPEMATGEPAAGASSSDASDTGNAGAQSNEAAAITMPQELAGFWRRMGALMIDALILLVVAKYLLLGLAIYGAVMWHFKGTTLGGMVMHVQVVRADGRAMDWSTCIVRALSCFLSLFALGLGFIWIALDRDRQAWHDKLAGTLVLYTPKGQSLV